MDTLNQMILGLNKEEIRFYKIYSSRISSNQPRKDIELFDLVRKEREVFDEDAAIAKLYPDGNKNPYYRLKNRLKSDLSKCLILQHFDNEDQTQAINLYNLARHYMSRNLYPLAEHFLGKAEKRALAIENLELLDLIYTEFIRLSQELLSINPETYILKRQENETRLKSLRQIDDILATVKYRLKITQNFSPVDNPVVDMLQETVQQLTDSKELKGSSALRFKIYQAVSQILLQQHDYPNLEDYLRVTYADFEKEKLFNRSNHQTKLQMLTYMVNALFKNDKSEESLQWAEKLKTAMEEFDRLHFDRFLFFYYNSLVINYSKVDMEKAISILRDLEHNEKLKKTPFYIVFVYLNLSIFHFDLGDYRESIKRLNQLYHHERFANTADSLKFRIAILEILIRLELGDTDFLEYRMKQIKKDFKEQLENQENVREAMLLDLISDMFLKGRSLRSDEMKDRIKLFTKTTSPRSEDAELVNYNRWLEQKLKA
ncbi:MAG: hypothetical protein H6603_07950 [Flavobacteriales bacterium]|nr:hypothetical protein [Flavobacteriales bacterium]MCB9192746.1 hypothetical protein [Flavobacteriales bacterium]MCB9204896.1 hypothetical protein [Flavobacteriales bacterium]